MRAFGWRNDAPVSTHVFVRRVDAYYLVAAYVPITEPGPVRGAMRALCLPGERRVHFQAGRDNRRREIVSCLTGLSARSRVYTGRGPRDAVRAALLRALVADVVDAGGRRLVVESRGHTRDRDDRRRVVSTLQRLRVPMDVLSYEHFEPHEDPAPWIADAVAWCFGAAGEWRRRVEPLIDKVVDLDQPHRA